MRWKHLQAPNRGISNGSVLQKANAVQHFNVNSMKKYKDTVRTSSPPRGQVQGSPGMVLDTILEAELLQWEGAFDARGIELEWLTCIPRLFLLLTTGWLLLYGACPKKGKPRCLFGVEAISLKMGDIRCLRRLHFPP